MVIEEIMRVLIVTEAFRWPLNGVAISIANMIKALMALGVAIHIVAPKTENDSNEFYVTRVNSFVSWLNRNYPFMLPWIKLWRLNAFSVEVPRVIHVHHPFCAGLVALWAARHWDIPLVATCHTMYALYLHYVPGGNLWRWPMERYLQWFYNQCDAVVVPSKATEAWLEGIGVRSSIEVIPTGVPLPDPEKISDQAVRELRISLGIPENAPVVLYVGRLAKEKNVVALTCMYTEILDKIPNAYLVVVGGGPQLSWFETRAGDMIHKGQMIVVGSRPHEELSPYFAMASVLVCPSLTETQGLILLEAGACNGTPSIVFRAGGIDELIEPDVNGIVLSDCDLGYFRPLAGAVIRLLNNPERLQAMRVACLARRHKHTPEVMAEKLFELYEFVTQPKLTKFPLG